MGRALLCLTFIAVSTTFAPHSSVSLSAALALAEGFEWSEYPAASREQLPVIMAMCDATEGRSWIREPKRRPHCFLKSCGSR
jgi:hypothetical protein